MNNSLPLPSERFPPVPNCPTPLPLLHSGSEDHHTFQITSSHALWTFTASPGQGTSESPRPFNLWFFGACITSETGVHTCAAEAGHSELQLHSSNHFSAEMENRTDQLSKGIASYLPGRTLRCEIIYQLHEICSQNTLKQKNNTKAF